MKSSSKNVKNYSRIKNNIRSLLFKQRFRRRNTHHFKSLIFTPEKVVKENVEFQPDELFVNRLIRFYEFSYSRLSKEMSSVWTGIFSILQGDIHKAFIDGNKQEIIDILQNPGKYNIFYGFENLSRDLISNKRLEDILEPEMTMDTMVSLCEALALIKITNPESLKIKTNPEANTLLELLENQFGFKINFPNPFQGETGILTRNGVASYRSIQAIYQAWKAWQLVKDIPNPKVLEIGGGLGRTAYYCRLFGVTDYSIVDIPLSSISQANFLSRTISPGSISFAGENNSEEKNFKILDPETFFQSTKEYDLILNVDSMTEMDQKIAEAYFNKITGFSRKFLSINHENNSFSVNDIWHKNPKMKKLSRNIYWLRKGYVEELFEKQV